VKLLFVGRNYSRGLKDSDSTSVLEVAQSQGLEIVSSLREQPDLLVCVDFLSHAQREVRKASRLGIATVLIANEPRVVVPQHSDPRILRDFDKVIRVGRPDQSPVLKWPQTWNFQQLEASRKRRAVVVNADKWSFVSGQLYWVRAAISANNDDVDVYGHGWDRGFLVRLAHRAFELLRTIGSAVFPNLKGLRYVTATPRNYKGIAADKIATMSKYKVALVIENSPEVMTEKLFDAWFAGCVPVYVGPPLAPFGIPDSLVIRCDDTSLESINLAITRALEVDREVFSKAVRSFLDEPSTQSWRAFPAISDLLREALKTLGPN
jgi:hypothetical protein